MWNLTGGQMKNPFLLFGLGLFACFLAETTAFANKSVLIETSLTQIEAQLDSQTSSLESIQTYIQSLQTLRPKLAEIDSEQIQNLTDKLIQVLHKLQQTQTKQVRDVLTVWVTLPGLAPGQLQVIYFYFVTEIYFPFFKNYIQNPQTPSNLVRAFYKYYWSQVRDDRELPIYAALKALAESPNLPQDVGFEILDFLEFWGPGSVKIATRLAHHPKLLENRSALKEALRRAVQRAKFREDRVILEKLATE